MKKAIFYKAKRNYLMILALVALFGVGLFFRLYHIEFGLPHSFHADEPEFVEPAIKYTFEIRNIIRDGEYFKLIPISYVYGTLPVYILTAATMAFSKLSNLAGIGFDKMAIYVFLRSLMAIATASLIFIVPYLYKVVFHKEHNLKLGMLIAAFLVAFNWKFIVHAHYLNADIILTVLLTLSYVTMLLYSQRKSDTKFTVLTGIFFGLAVGTKVTALMAVPLYLALFAHKKDYRSMFAFCFVAFGAYVISNPFPFAFADDLAYRVYELSIKENGLVFDSVNTNPLKYLGGLSYMLTPLVLLLAVYGGVVYAKVKENLWTNIFLLGTIAIYLFFFSIGTRRVDRWLLPIIPIIILYASFGAAYLKEQIKPYFYFPALVALMLVYMYFPVLTLSQFYEHTPKSEAYLWMRDNIDPAANKLIITEEGLDPMNKLQSSFVLNYEVYESENAQFRLPESPDGYHYVVLASRPMENFKKKAVREKFPFYHEAWSEFEQELQDPTRFELIKAYELPKPNLIEVSDVYIYKNLDPVETPVLYTK